MIIRLVSPTQAEMRFKKSQFPVTFLIDIDFSDYYLVFNVGYFDVRHFSPNTLPQATTIKLNISNHTPVTGNIVNVQPTDKQYVFRYTVTFALPSSLPQDTDYFGLADISATFTVPTPSGSQTITSTSDNFYIAIAEPKLPVVSVLAPNDFEKFFTSQITCFYDITPPQGRSKGAVIFKVYSGTEASKTLVWTKTIFTDENSIILGFPDFLFSTGEYELQVTAFEKTSAFVNFAQTILRKTYEEDYLSGYYGNYTVTRKFYVEQSNLNIATTSRDIVFTEKMNGFAIKFMAFPACSLPDENGNIVNYLPGVVKITATRGNEVYSEKIIDTGSEVFTEKEIEVKLYSYEMTTVKLSVIGTSEKATPKPGQQYVTAGIVASIEKLVPPADIEELISEMPFAAASSVVETTSEWAAINISAVHVDEYVTQNRNTHLYNTCFRLFDPENNTYSAVEYLDSSVNPIKPGCVLYYSSMFANTGNAYAETIITSGKAKFIVLSEQAEIDQTTVTLKGKTYTKGPLDCVGISIKGSNGMLYINRQEVAKFTVSNPVQIGPVAQAGVPIKIQAITETNVSYFGVSIRYPDPPRISPINRRKRIYEEFKPIKIIDTPKAEETKKFYMPRVVYYTPNLQHYTHKVIVSTSGTNPLVVVSENGLFDAISLPVLTPTFVKIRCYIDGKLVSLQETPDGFYTVTTPVDTINNFIKLPPCNVCEVYFPAGIGLGRDIEAYRTKEPSAASFYLKGGSGVKVVLALEPGTEFVHIKSEKPIEVHNRANKYEGTEIAIRTYDVEETLLIYTSNDTSIDLSASLITSSYEMGLSAIVFNKPVRVSEPKKVELVFDKERTINAFTMRLSNPVTVELFDSNNSLIYSGAVLDNTNNITTTTTTDRLYLNIYPRPFSVISDIKFQLTGEEHTYTLSMFGNEVEIDEPVSIEITLPKKTFITGYSVKATGDISTTLLALLDNQLQPVASSAVAASFFEPVCSDKFILNIIPATKAKISDINLYKEIIRLNEEKPVNILDIPPGYVQYYDCGFNQDGKLILFSNSSLVADFVGFFIDRYNIPAEMIASVTYYFDEEKIVGIIPFYNLYINKDEPYLHRSGVPCTGSVMFNYVHFTLKNPNNAPLVVDGIYAKLDLRSGLKVITP